MRSGRRRMVTKLRRLPRRSAHIRTMMSPFRRWAWELPTSEPSLGATIRLRRILILITARHSSGTLPEVMAFYQTCLSQLATDRAQDRWAAKTKWTGTPRQCREKCNQIVSVRTCSIQKASPYRACLFRHPLPNFSRLAFGPAFLFAQTADVASGRSLNAVMRAGSIHSGS